MGTIMSTIALQTEKVDFLIGEGFVLDPIEIKNKVLKLKGKEITLPKSSNDYLEMVSNLKLPILLFSGIKDEFTTTKDSEKVINMSKNRRSEEHTSELQSRPHLVCRLLLEKKKTTIRKGHI